MPQKSNQLKGKEWYTLVAPDMFDNQELGEAPATTEEALLGRKVEAGATDLVKSSNKYYFKMNFKVENVEGNEAKCKFVGHDCSRDFITRMIRKRSKRVDDRTTVETDDGVKLVVKTVCATIKPVGSSTQTGIRKKISQFLKDRVSDVSLKEFVNSMLSGKLQKQIKESSDKVYPLRQIEFRKTEVVE